MLFLTDRVLLSSVSDIMKSSDEKYVVSGAAEQVITLVVDGQGVISRF